MAKLSLFKSGTLLVKSDTSHLARHSTAEQTVHSSSMISLTIGRLRISRTGSNHSFLSRWSVCQRASHSWSWQIRLIQKKSALLIGPRPKIMLALKVWSTLKPQRKIMSTSSRLSRRQQLRHYSAKVRCSKAQTPVKRPCAQLKKIKGSS